MRVGIANQALLDVGFFQLRGLPVDLRERQVLAQRETFHQWRPFYVDLFQGKCEVLTLLFKL